MRSVLSGLAVVAMVVATQLSNARLANMVRTAVVVYFTLALVFQLAMGVRRRLPHWTAESWRRYVIACVPPVATLTLLFGLMFWMDAGSPIFGAPRSALRNVWVFGLVVFLIAGALGLHSVIAWLEDGDAPKQFEYPRWLRRSRGSAT